MRYRLRTLLIAVAFAAVFVAFVLNCYRLHEANIVIAKQRSEIRTLSHRLGLLTPEDLPFVQIRRVKTDGQLPAISGGHQGIDLTWLIHLPSDKHWRLFWADEDIPLSGIAARHSGYRDLTTSDTEWTWLSVSFPYNSVSGWSAEYSYGGYDGTKWSSPIPSERAEWLEPNATTRGECAGPIDHHTGEIFIDQFSCDKPIVVYRERRLSKMDELTSFDSFTDDPKPCQGYMIWLESIDLPEP